MPAAPCDEVLPAYVIAGLGGFVGRESSGRLEDRRLAPSAWIGGGYRVSRFLSIEAPIDC
jgi:hypothetical protein